MHLHIRKAELSDLHQIVEIEERVFPDPWTETQLKYELTEQPAALNQVAADGNTIVGYLMSHVIYDVVQLINIAVDLPLQHRGVGRLLIESFIDQLMDRAPFRIFLEVSDSNLIAIQFYRKYGFKKIDLRKNYYQNGDNALVMVKEFDKNGLVQA